MPPIGSPRGGMMSAADGGSMRRWIFQAVAALALVGVTAGVTALVVLRSTAPPPASQPVDTKAEAEAAYRSRDYATAFRLFEQQAAAGDALAEYRVGAMLSQGEGTEKNPSGAAEWLRKAADQGQVDAQVLLGRFYLNGVGWLLMPLPEPRGSGRPRSWAMPRRSAGSVSFIRAEPACLRTLARR